MNSSGLINRRKVPSRRGVLSFSSTCQGALVWIRSSDSADQVMYHVGLPHVLYQHAAACTHVGVTPFG